MAGTPVRITTTRTKEREETRFMCVTDNAKAMADSSPKRTLTLTVSRRLMVTVVVLRRRMMITAASKFLHLVPGQCIHPSQVETAQRIFGPETAEVTWAVRVVVADEKAAAAGRGAWTLDGKMIDVPVAEKARTIVKKKKTNKNKRKKKQTKTKARSE